MFSSPTKTSLDNCPHANDCTAFEGGFCWFKSHKVVVVETVRVPALGNANTAVKRQASSPSLVAPNSNSNSNQVIQQEKRQRVSAPLPVTSVNRHPSITKTNTTTTTTTTSRPTHQQHQPARKIGPVPAPLINTASRPIVSASLHSKVDRAKRQKILDLFYNEFARIYAPISAQSPTLAHEHAFAQENALQRKCNNPTTYTTMAVPILNRLRKRPVATSSTDTGIDGIYTPPDTSNPHGSLFANIPPPHKFESLLMTQQDLMKHEFPTIEALAPVFLDPLLALEVVKQEKVACVRCRREFLPKHDMEPGDWEACTYHRSRATLQVLNGTAPTSRTKIHPCCQLDQTSPGCSAGPHVFKETEWKDLNSRIPFTMLPENPNPKWKIVGIDCEMSYTTGGMELTRVTIVDVTGGAILLDELVKPQFTVLDLNSDYSGITDLSKAKYTLPQLHNLLFQSMSSSTILVGHGLENDLISLRLLHARIIDTTVLFPRPQPPATSNLNNMIWKNSLKMLCEKVLGKRIQVVNSVSVGHDSAEDARGALELVLFYLRQKEKGVLISY
ncbi:UNVERIFIED_CONTAM: RNA exonuclease 3 [Siphonaria sp. JEL0065]|nr:RNA exonuclease 3 [Siphonaria sp. JEL0065]